MINWMTFGFLRDSVLRENKIADSAIPKSMQQGYINQVLMECWDYLNRANDPFYNLPVVLSFSQLPTGEIVADLSQVYFKMVNVVTDDNDNDFNQVLDPKVFYNARNDYAFSAKVVWYQQGSLLMFWVGARSKPLGANVIAELRMKPEMFSDATINNTVDIPPEQNTYLMDRVTELFCRHAGVPVPADVVQRNAAAASASTAAKEAVVAEQLSKTGE